MVGHGLFRTVVFPPSPPDTAIELRSARLVDSITAVGAADPMAVGRSQCLLAAIVIGIRSL